MNLTELKNAIIGLLGLPEKSTEEAVLAAFSEKMETLKNTADEAVTKLDKFKEDYKITELTEKDYKEAAITGFKLTGETVVFVSKSLVSFRVESYCKENSKGFYYRAEKAGNDVTLKKIEN